jgi:hypothetical protein
MDARKQAVIRFSRWAASYALPLAMLCDLGVPCILSKLATEIGTSFWRGQH